MIAPAVLEHPEARLILSWRISNMENSTERNKTFAHSEREKIRELFKAKASNPPIPNPFDAVSMRKWGEYCEEMQELEAQLKAAGESL